MSQDTQGNDPSLPVTSLAQVEPRRRVNESGQHGSNVSTPKVTSRLWVSSAARVSRREPGWLILELQEACWFRGGLRGELRAASTAVWPFTGDAVSTRQVTSPASSSGMGDRRAHRSAGVLMHEPNDENDNHRLVLRHQRAPSPACSSTTGPTPRTSATSPPSIAARSSPSTCSAARALYH